MQNSSRCKVQKNSNATPGPAVYKTQKVPMKHPTPRSPRPFSATSALRLWFCFSDCSMRPCSNFKLTSHRSHHKINPAGTTRRPRPNCPLVQRLGHLPLEQVIGVRIPGGQPSTARFARLVNSLFSHEPPQIPAFSRYNSGRGGNPWQICLVWSSC
jgi:hypothetical protein